MYSRRGFLAQISFFLAGLAGCDLLPRSDSSGYSGRLTIGVVTYGEGSRSVEQYSQFVEYLEAKTLSLIELEPAYNERKAIQQIQRQIWSLVFAPPGLAAIAISKARYLPIFPLQGTHNLRSVFIVLKKNPVTKLSDLSQKVVGIGQQGSAAGYYSPLYDLYGLTLAELRLAPTPQALMEWVAQGDVVAGALAEEEFNLYRSSFKSTQFRILYTSRLLPPGAILISPNVERNQENLIRQVLTNAPRQVAERAGYIQNAKALDYGPLITFINKVKPIEERIKEKPAVLFQSSISKSIF
jgi:phosphonate transport system substrate-binding protein